MTQPQRLNTGASYMDEDIVQTTNSNGSENYSGTLDIKGLSVGIIIAGDSSKTRLIQRTGRCIRAEEGKKAEMFNLVINNTQELNWFKNANANSSVIYLTESQLDDILAGKQVGKEKQVVGGNLKYRY